MLKMLPNMWNKLALLLVIFFFGCTKKEHTFDVVLYLETSIKMDVQMFYSTSFWDRFSEERSAHLVVEPNRPVKANFEFKSAEKIKRVRIDFNTNQELTIHIDSIKIFDGKNTYYLQAKHLESWMIPNEQVKLIYTENKMIVKTFKTEEVYDPYLITKNLQKYLD